MISYAVTLSDALTPITLISGVGLLLLAMTARYNYTTDRVRALLKERRQKAPAVDPVLEKAIRHSCKKVDAVPAQFVYKKLRTDHSCYCSGMRFIISLMDMHISSHSFARWYSRIVRAAFCIAGKPVRVSWLA